MTAPTKKPPDLLTTLLAALGEYHDPLVRRWATALADGQTAASDDRILAGRPRRTVCVK
jgi:hypothetical protein